MNPLCKVCGDPAAGFHFGAFTCEGCKSFFGRACKNSQSIPVCKKNNRCEINKNTRTTCKACRLTKCIQVGMSKEGSKFGRRSNWFKIKFLLEERRKSCDKEMNDSEKFYQKSMFEHFVEPKTTEPTTSVSSSSSSSASSPNTLNGSDTQFLNVPHISPPLATTFHSAAIQYPFHSPFLYSTIEKLTAFYLNHHILKQHQHQQQQQHHHLQQQQPQQQQTQHIMGTFPNNINAHFDKLTDKQDDPIDLSVKPKFPIDFTISGLMKVHSS